MSLRLIRIVAIALFASAALLTTTSSLSAQSAKKAATVSGKWTLTVAGNPHGNVAMGLTLAQDGTHVTGTFASPHGDMPVDGDFTDGTLKLATTGGDADSHITFEGRLKDDDTLDGYLSSPMGDMRWTARRAKDGK